MAVCVECNHRLDVVGRGREQIFWCPRCGSLDDGLIIRVPEVVVKLRKFVNNVREMAQEEVSNG